MEVQTLVKEKLTFDHKKEPEFITELRQKIKAYFRERNISKYGNTQIIWKSIFMISLYALPYLLMVFGVIQSVAGLIVCWAAMGLGKAGVGLAIMHDSNHGTFSRNKKINKYFAKSLYFVGGFPPNWRHQHNTLHHGYTNIEGHDDDITTIDILRFSPHKPLKKVHRFQHIYAWVLYGFMTIGWVSTGDFKQLKKYYADKSSPMSKKPFSALLFDLVTAKALYYLVFLVVPIVFLPISWWAVLLLFLMMHFITGLILSTIFQTAHVMPNSEFPLPNNVGLVENNWAIHQLQTTSNYAPNSRFFSWFVGGLNFQVEHHLFPNISHVHYKKISVLVKETAQKYNLPYYVEPTFWMAIKRHYQMLKALGRQKSLVKTC